MVSGKAIPGYKITIGDETIILNGIKYQLLRSILNTGSLTAVAKELDVSYGTVLNYIEQMESGLNVKIINTTKGGKGGGGGTTLTEEGHSILVECEKINANLDLHTEVNEFNAEITDIDEANGMVTIDMGKIEIVAPYNNDYEIGDKILALISCDNIVLMLEPQTSSMSNLFKGKIVEMRLKNGIVKVKIDVNGMKFCCDITISSGQKLKLNLGSEIYAGFKATSVGILKI